MTCRDIDLGARHVFSKVRLGMVLGPVNTHPTRGLYFVLTFLGALEADVEFLPVCCCEDYDSLVFGDGAENVHCAIY